jgi:transcriptional regulator with XRE-family HTH domain
MDTQQVAALIHATGMKQTDIALALDVNVSTVRRWASGNSMPSNEHIEQLQQLAGTKPKLRPLGSRKPAAAILADVPATVLIEELARRARGGTLKDGNSGSLDAGRPADTPRKLRAVAFTDVADD